VEIDQKLRGSLLNYGVIVIVIVIGVSSASKAANLLETLLAMS
jgi:hypothetical protein